MLNKSHLQSTDRYLMAGEYIVEGFRTILGEEKFQELREKLSGIKGEAAGKVERVEGNEVRYEPMDDEI